MSILMKCNFPQLQHIDFLNNPITSIEKFFRIHSKKIEKYAFVSFSGTYPHQTEDYQFLCKMENIVPKIISI